jgi:hypothetical protein
MAHSHLISLFRRLTRCILRSLFFSLLISAMINHGMVLHSTCSSTNIPIQKGSQNGCNSNNYRGLSLSSILHVKFGISLSSILGKVIDLILLDRLFSKLDISHLQFGFERGHSTNMCTIVLKETVAYYTSNESSVHCLMLDATEAFDRVDNYTRCLLNYLIVIFLLWLLDLCQIYTPIRSHV